MEEQEKIKNDIRQWIAVNRQALPLHTDCWIIQVTANPEAAPQSGLQERSKPAAGRSLAFYKPYTKTSILP